MMHVPLTRNEGKRYLTVARWCAERNAHAGCCVVRLGAGGSVWRLNLEAQGIPAASSRSEQLAACNLHQHRRNHTP
jgi:hypothetical protein